MTAVVKNTGRIGKVLVAHDALALKQRIHLLLMAAILCRMNCILLLFNLLPVPGLDGWNAFRSLFPNIRVPNTEAVKGIFVFLIFAALYCSSWISEFSMWVLLQSFKVFS